MLTNEGTPLCFQFQIPNFWQFLILISLTYKTILDIFIRRRLQWLFSFFFVIHLISIVDVKSMIDFARIRFLFIKGANGYASAVDSMGRLLKRYYSAKMAIGINQRIFSFVQSHGQLTLLPGKKIETEIDYSYRMWHRFTFGEPLVVRAITLIGKKGLNFDHAFLKKPCQTLI